MQSHIYKPSPFWAVLLMLIGLSMTGVGLFFSFAYFLAPSAVAGSVPNATINVAGFFAINILEICMGITFFNAILSYRVTLHPDSIESFYLFFFFRRYRKIAREDIVAKDKMSGGGATAWLYPAAAKDGPLKIGSVLRVDDYYYGWFSGIPDADCAFFRNRRAARKA
jgi:hypothetical protein